MQFKMFSKFYPPLTLVVVMMTMINVTVLATAITVIIITVIVIAVVTAIKTYDNTAYYLVIQTYCIQNPVPQRK